MGWNFGPIGQMAQGRIPFDAREFELRAGPVAALTPMLAESYGAESRDVAGSKARPARWARRADFDAKLKDLVDRSADTAGACRACHAKYKAD